jgi:sugar phosphate isomerase/epimerase
MSIDGTKLSPSIGVAHFSAIGLSPVEFAKSASRAGFSRIGVRLNPAFAGAPYYELPIGGSEASELKKVLASEGMEVFDIEFFVVDPSFVPSSFERTIAAAADIGARRLSVCCDDPERPRLVSRFSDFCALAAQYGLAVDVENMGWRVTSTFEDSVGVVRESGAANAGVLVDALHFFRNGGTIASLKQQVDCVRHVQLCDAAGSPPTSGDAMITEARGGRLAPGEGDLPLKELLKAVEGIAEISVEVPLVGARTTAEHLKHLHHSAKGLFRLDR